MVMMTAEVGERIGDHFALLWFENDGFVTMMWRIFRCASASRFCRYILFSFLPTSLFFLTFSLAFFYP